MQEARTLTLSEVLLSLDQGGTVEEIQTKIREVVTATIATGNSGSVTIKLGFKRNGGEGSNQIVVTDTVTTAMPKRPKPSNLFFATQQGSLSDENPSQPRLAGVDFTGGAR